MKFYYKQANTEKEIKDKCTKKTDEKKEENICNCGIVKIKGEHPKILETIYSLIYKMHYQGKAM